MTQVTVPTAGPLTPEEERQWIRAAHQEVADLFGHRPVLYWADLLLSAAAAWSGTVLYFMATPFSGWQLLGLLVAGIAFYRAGTFMHEIIHMPRGVLVNFRRAWNLLIGVPLLMPWVLYRNHIGHHTRAHFGTPDDGEYLPLAAAPLRDTLLYLVKVPLLSLMAFARFAIAAPLSWLIPPLRRWLLERGSAYVSNPYYRKPFPKKDRRHLLIVEALCLAWVLFWVGMTVFGPVEPIHWLMAWVLHAFTLGLNWVRNLAAHRYDNPGQAMSHIAQLQDAVNITGQTWLTCWLFPVGLRYHALHHLFPGLPYHSMGEAHRRLVDRFGPDSPYAAANHSSFFRVVGQLLRSASDTRPEASAIAVWRAAGRAPASGRMAG
ncbi:fatty acid desaturase family protein [Wenzhouxiangella marina]|uniref:Fatty acid desaturase n=1 Tax=Wenzhouxiangella marina TaxID=1579979 RepID=A0A0K0XVU0_9GAMM|nr:fatty acid desaturase [Wenzhouxiangella marina]AKS41824.1 Fatty acid desaturase [Wenzhouxiangella marina]MBB6086414.1 fatty acid desaturase [Wenzhouxiangella marina]